jgi:hypothetical protein
VVKTNLTKEQAIDKLWRAGNLEWKLKGIQKEMRKSVYESKGKKTTFLISRRSGKSFTMCILAVEQCIRVPNSVVKVLFPKKKDAKTVARDQMKTILDDCPADIKPEWMEADKLFVFPNGSEIQMAGTDSGSAESVRGSRCHLAILDEAGFMDYNEFSYIVQSIIMPTLLTTKGKMILASTPSKEPDHPFMTDYVLPARKEGTLIEYDIYSNPMITEKDIEEIASEYPGGRDDPAFLREFMLQCEVVSDDFIVPEFNESIKKDIVGERKAKPSYYDYYVSGDPAATDLTHILFGYYDYLGAKLVIADEVVLGGPGEMITTQDIADGIRRKEKINFSNPLTHETYEPYMRVMDYNNKILMFDLDKEHGLKFIPTAKDNKDAQINKLRLMIRQGKIEISPKCQNLIYQLQAGRWKKTKEGKVTGFERLKGIKDQGLRPNHCDGVDALLYMIRNVDFNKNPYPAGYLEMSEFSTSDTLFMPERLMKNRHNEIEELVNSLINRRKK